MAPDELLETGIPLDVGPRTPSQGSSRGETPAREEAIVGIVVLDVVLQEKEANTTARFIPRDRDMTTSDSTFAAPPGSGGTLAPPNHFLQDIHQLDYNETVLKNISRMRMGYLADRYVVTVRMLCPNALRKASVVPDKHSKDGTYMLSVARWFARYSEGIRTGEFNPRIEGVAQAMRLILSCSDIMMALSILSEADRQICLGERAVSLLRQLCKDNAVDHQAALGCECVDTRLKECLEMLPGFQKSVPVQMDLLRTHPAFAFPLSILRYVIREFILETYSAQMTGFLNHLMNGYLIWQNSQIGYNVSHNKATEGVGKKAASQDGFSPTKWQNQNVGIPVKRRSSSYTESGSTCASNPDSRSTDGDEISEGSSFFTQYRYSRERSSTGDSLELGEKPSGDSEQDMCFLSDYVDNIVKNSENLNISSLMRRFGVSMTHLIPQTIVDDISAHVPHCAKREESKSSFFIGSATDPHNFVQKFKKLGCAFGWLSERVLTGGKVHSTLITAGLRAVLTCPDVMVALAALPSEQRSYVLSNAYMYIVNVNHGDTSGVGITAMTPVPADVQFTVKAVDPSLLNAVAKLPGMESTLATHESICQTHRRFGEAIALTRFAVKDFYHTRCPAALEKLTCNLNSWVKERAATTVPGEDSLTETMSCPDTNRDNKPVELQPNVQETEKLNTVAGDLSSSPICRGWSANDPASSEDTEDGYVSVTLYSPKVLRKIDRMSITELVSRFSSVLPRLTLRFRDKLTLLDSGQSSSSRRCSTSSQNAETNFVGRFRKLAHSFCWLSTGVKNGNIDSKLIKKAMRVLLCCPDVMYCLAALDAEHREYAISNAYVRIISVNYGDPSGVDKAQRLTPLPPNCSSITSVFGKSSVAPADNLVHPCLDHILYAIPSTRSAMIKAVQLAQSTPRFDEALAITRFSISEFMKSRQPQVMTDLCDALCSELKLNSIPSGIGFEDRQNYAIEKLSQAEDAAATETGKEVVVHASVFDTIGNCNAEMDTNSLARHFDYLMDSIVTHQQQNNSSLTHHADTHESPVGKRKTWWDTAVHVKYRLWSDSCFRGLANAVARRYLGRRTDSVPENLLAQAMRDILCSLDIILGLAVLPIHWRCRAMDRAAEQMLKEVDSRGSRAFGSLAPASNIDDRLTLALKRVGWFSKIIVSNTWSGALDTCRGVVRFFLDKHAQVLKEQLIQSIDSLRETGCANTLSEQEYFSVKEAENLALDVTETVLSPTGEYDSPWPVIGSTGEASSLFQIESDPVAVSAAAFENESIDSLLTSLGATHTSHSDVAGSDQVSASMPLELSHMSNLGVVFHKDISFHNILYTADTHSVQETESTGIEKAV